MFIAAFFTVAKVWRQHKCASGDELIKKWCVYTMQYDSAINNELNLAICNNMNEQREYVLSEISQRKTNAI